ncbi:hemolysin XhlA family protein [Enterococcus faecalis]|uniref:hemolysin XhlA family protein n=1 Tax=Enterococcus TaxID=1350 RepID=UPI002091BCB3|nr:hemolysin XhlA family protein [Enterococcus faecalis]MCO5519371.1 hemolysin XhlA family protein [Enterococcus faecalis]
MPENENALWREVLQRLTRIEENTKHVDTITNKANKALIKAEENEKDIAEIRENQKWTWRTVVGMGVSVIVYLITKFLGGQ